MRTILRWLLSKAANLTPNVIYYPKSWRVRMNEGLIDTAAKRGKDATSMSVAAVSLCCAMHSDCNIMAGDTATITLHGVTNAGGEVGDFIVTARRVA